MKIKLSVLLSAILAFISLQTMAQTGDISIGKTTTIKSSVLNEDRNIMIYLPAGYQLTTDKYPVFYILDGETHFNYTAGVVQFLAQNNLIPQMIVVGIPNTNRNRDFTPTKAAHLPQSGGADNFLDFLNKDVFPFIETNFRTQTYRILAGHSLCGMFAFYALFNRPDYFNAYIGLSPWVIYDNGFLVEHAKTKLPGLTSLNKPFYFTAGSLEEQILPKMNEFLDVLKNKAPKDFIWQYKLMENENHGSLVLLTIYDGLKFIYKDWPLPQDSAEKGISAIINHYKNLSNKYGYEITAPEFTLNISGYTLLAQQRFDEAIEIFKKNVELHPGSANVYDSLGEAYERTNNMKLAKENYEKAYNMAIKESNAFLETYKANYERAVRALAN